MKYEELRRKYKTFIYEKYEIKEEDDNYVITYYFTIKDLIEFTPKLIIKKELLDIFNSLLGKIM